MTYNSKCIIFGPSCVDSVFLHRFCLTPILSCAKRGKKNEKTEDGVVHRSRVIYTQGELLSCPVDPRDVWVTCCARKCRVRERFFQKRLLYGKQFVLDFTNHAAISVSVDDRCYAGRHSVTGWCLRGCQAGAHFLFLRCLLFFISFLNRPF